MTQILPLTPGLLISMSIRNDHGFGAGDAYAAMMGRPAQPLHETQIETIDVSYAEYVEAYNGRHCQSQRLEECTGNGFYQIEREAGYREMADPIALRHAKQLVEQFSNLLSITPGRPTQV